MDMFLTFVPERIIEGIKEAKVGERNLNANELSRLKNKLFEAEQNKNIIRLARGEGRTGILDQIVSNDNIVFNWGLKGQHAFHQQSQLRDFLEPNAVDSTQMKEIVKIFKNDIGQRYSKNFHRVSKRIENADSLIKKLYSAIDKNSDSQTDLLLIKDWICAVLHTAGTADFKNISPWVSATAGDERYKTAYFFGMGYFPFSRRNAQINKRFVIFFTWVNKNEEHHIYERTQYLIDSFRRLGLPWYNDKHHEIMLKYAIYPHRLIGYYYFENDNLLYYKVNPHYLEYINDDAHFAIGDDISIDQSSVIFPADNPYNVIYSRSGMSFDVYDRR